MAAVPKASLLEELRTRMQRKFGNSPKVREAIHEETQKLAPKDFLRIQDIQEVEDILKSYFGRRTAVSSLQRSRVTMPPEALSGFRTEIECSQSHGSAAGISQRRTTVAPERISPMRCMEVFTGFKQSALHRLANLHPSRGLSKTPVIGTSASPKKIPRAWDVVVLAQDEWDRQEALRKKRLHEDKLIAHKSYLRHQIRQKQRTAQRKLIESAEQDSSLIYSNTVKSEIEASQRISKRLARIRVEREDLSRTVRQESTKKERAIEAKVAEMLESSTQKLRYETEEKLKTQSRKALCQKVQGTNLQMMSATRLEKFKSRALQLEQDRERMQNLVEVMRKDEEQWGSQFRKRLKRMERVQRNLSPIGIQRTTEDVMANLRCYPGGNEARTRKRADFVDSLKKIIREGKDAREQQQCKSVLKERGNLRIGEEERRRRLRLLNKRQTKKYAEFLESQVKEKAEREGREECEFSPQELAMNKGILRRLGVLATTFKGISESSDNINAAAS